MIIYKVTNIINGKFYIGLTKKKLSSPKGRHKLRSKAFEGLLYNAIRKHGWDNFKWEIIDSDATSYEHLKVLEIWYIENLKPEYNMTKGGDGTVGKICSPKAKQRSSEVNTGNKYCFGSKRSDESKLKMSLFQKRRIRTPEEILKWKNASLGVKRSDEFRKNISDKLKGKPKSEAHRLALSRSKMNKPSPLKGRKKIKESV